ncbi:MULTISPECIES: YdeI/OmpD-associated family protein [unclassified Novosphingobium]|uniref:YdeI/OmpD-associated family protein n=1 Tax=unclassified Novosphingobium TaxID=2644732 RepID=UPI00086D4DE6|nr:MULTISPECIES: YdeI/OmpD-associated family protein [unclassified Novosphingobium]MBN9143576.1 YdeI/OmpD-associated family protein [Novosphingobium sp.]MDR6706826.1 uncharacterized protein YdeI (YjbR/CyaY-like superfamily) [Novosphingobium sp. 1748]ODU83670.1 MAG: hypothetical protein ABT10_05230 [Novosphingobium sp. SCN 63-17]OJX92748.1 MAG: hypothetical protein BGP00_22690 [Novosphingobium sp. 63-713]
MDQRIDAYIAAAPDFARPILIHLRRAVHEAVPGLGETIKWSMPHFTLNGKNLAGMAAFKAHCAFVIHGAGRQGGEEGHRDDGLGAYGKIASMDDLPDPDTFRMRLMEAAQGLSGTTKAARAPKAPKAEIAVPDDLTEALAENVAARAVFEGFAPSHRRDYLEWIVEAKAPATRARRIAQAVEWMGEGKRRNWKYEKC